MYVIIIDTETTGLFPRNKNPSTHTHGASSAPFNPSVHDTYPYAVQVSYAIIDTSSPFFPIVEDYDAIVRISDETPLPAESVAIHGITRDIIRTRGVPIEHVLSILQRSIDTYDVQLVVGHNVQFDLRVLSTEYSRCSERASSAHYAVLQPPLCGSVQVKSNPPAPSSSPDPTSTPEGATSTPFNPSVHKGLRLGIDSIDSNTFASTPECQPRGLMGIPWFCTARESVGVCNLRVDSMYGGTYLKFGKLGQVFEILFKERDAVRGVDMKVFEKYMHNSRVDVLMCARVYVWLCYSVDVFDAWYCEMQNYADENFINVDDSHLVREGEQIRPEPPIYGGGVDHPFETPHLTGRDSSLSPGPGPSPSLSLSPGPSPGPSLSLSPSLSPSLSLSLSPSPSPRRSDRLRLKRMLVQEQGSVLVSL